MVFDCFAEKSCSNPREATLCCRGFTEVQTTCKLLGVLHKAEMRGEETAGPCMLCVRQKLPNSSASFLVGVLFLVSFFVTVFNGQSSGQRPSRNSTPSQHPTKAAASFSSAKLTTTLSHSNKLRTFSCAAFLLSSYASRRSLRIFETLSRSSSIFLVFIAYLSGHVRKCVLSLLFAVVVFVSFAQPLSVRFIRREYKQKEKNAFQFG